MVKKAKLIHLDEATIATIRLVASIEGVSTKRWMEETIKQKAKDKKHILDAVKQSMKK